MVADYYAILGVDPGADAGAIEAALARSQPAWSSGTRNPKNKHTFQSYLDQIPALRRALLSGVEARAAYDAERAASQRAERDVKLSTLHRLVRLRAAKGGLTVSDRALLKAEAQRLGIGNDALERLAEPYPPLPETPADVDPPDPPVDAIDPATRRQIRVTLDHLRRRDLYDALGLPRDAPTREIAARADAERQRWMQKAQVTAEKTAWLEVISYAQSHLATAEGRARYDRTLGLEAEHDLVAAIEFALKNVKELAPGTRHILHDEAEASGITPERADRLIDRACKNLGVSRDATNAKRNGHYAPPRYLRCRSCSGLTAFDAVSKNPDTALCRHCRAPLTWHCPVCQRVRWLDEPRCVCGFPLEHVEPLVRYFEAAQHAHRVQDFEGALAHLRKVQEFAPRHIGARKGIDKVKERLAEIDAAHAAFETERSARRFVAARAALQAWGRLVDATSPEIRKALAEVQNGLREALDLAAQARSFAPSDPVRARKLYLQALNLAADLPEARVGLRQLPPEPPSHLVAELVQGRIRLRWTPPAADGPTRPTIKVVRKPGSIPQHTADGIVIAEVAASECDDPAPPAGETVGYAAFSVREGITSTQGATAGPIAVLLDVADLRTEAQSREVVLAWAVPPACLDVRVVRKSGIAPTGPNDGELIPATRSGAIDRTVQEDVVYHYGVFARYRVGDGRILTAPGIAISAVPSSPILEIVALTLRREPDGRLRISWEAPERGTVKIYRSNAPLPFPPGERITGGKLDGDHGGCFLPRGEADHSYDPQPPESGLIVYTAMIARGTALTVGRAAAFSNVSDPTDLRAIRTGRAGKVLLRWRWSPRAAQSLVLARQGTPPTGPDDSHAEKSVVDEVEYSRLGSFSLILPPGETGPWHVLVVSLAQVDAETIPSPGLDPTCRTIVPGPTFEVTLNYTLQAPGLLGRNWTVAFRTDPPGAEIPPTALVAHARTVPLSLDDGQIVARFPAGRDGDRQSIRPAIDLHAHRCRIFADPHADPNTTPSLRIRHPETGVTRV